MSEAVCLVLYEQGVPRHRFTSRVLTREVLIRFREDLDPVAASSQLLSALPGAEAAAFSLKSWRVFRAPDPEGAFELRERVRTNPDVMFAEVQLATEHETKLTPNDTLFPWQWHLSNSGQNGGTPGCDLNVTNLWDARRGAGVIIGVVDNGVQAAHPDLAPNLLLNLSTNLNTNSFSTNYDRHGSAVAGLIAARGDNGIGVTGVAFESSLADIRLLGEPVTDLQDAIAVLHEYGQIQVKNNSWGAADGTGVLDGPGPLMVAALEEATERGRSGRGTVFIFAAGNGRSYGEDVNYDGYANSSRVIAVGAVTDQGEVAAYSEPGACLAVSAPSGSGVRLCTGGRQALTTTDLLGAGGYNAPGATCELLSPDYTQNFSGTSGATALVAGVAGLLLEANPALGWRDVKEVLMRSARKVMPLDPDWQTNLAGICHNHRLGAGMVDAGRAVDLAMAWSPLGGLRIVSQAETGLNLAIPDNDPAGIVRTFTVTNAGFRVETVGLRVTAPHAYFGDLAVTLTSPDGTVSRLAERHNSSGSGYDSWTLTSARHWGEFASGTWTVKIADLSPTRTGTLQALQLELLGSKPELQVGISRTNTAWLLSVSAAATGANCALETSTNLTHWRSLASLRIREDGTATHAEPSTGGSGSYYRVRLLEH